MKKFKCKCGVRVSSVRLFNGLGLVEIEPRVVVVDFISDPPPAMVLKTAFVLHDCKQQGSLDDSGTPDLKTNESGQE